MPVYDIVEIVDGSFFGTFSNYFSFGMLITTGFVAPIGVIRISSVLAIRFRR